MTHTLKPLLLLSLLLTMAVCAFSDTAEDFYKSVKAKSDKGDVDGARADFTKVLKLEPDYPGAQTALDKLKKK